MNGRKVWGGLVPYGQVWRAGANENTTITFANDVTIEGKPLAAGTYGLHMIPNENDWTVIFSKMHTAWGSFSYKESEDALRVTVKPQPTEMHNALTYDFDQLQPDSAVVVMSWDKVAVPFKVSVDVNKVVEASLNNQLRGLSQYTWDGWDDAATYLVDNKVDLQRGAEVGEQLHPERRPLRKRDDEVAHPGSAWARTPRRSRRRTKRSRLAQCAAALWLRPPAAAREEAAGGLRDLTRGGAERSQQLVVACRAGARRLSEKGTTPRPPSRCRRRWPARPTAAKPGVEGC